MSADPAAAGGEDLAEVVSGLALVCEDCGDAEAVLECECCGDHLCHRCWGDGDQFCAECMGEGLGGRPIEKVHVGGDYL